MSLLAQNLQYSVRRTVPHIVAADALHVPSLSTTPMLRSSGSPSSTRRKSDDDRRLRGIGNLRFANKHAERLAGLR